MKRSVLFFLVASLVASLMASAGLTGAEVQTVVFDLAMKPEETRRRAYEQANIVHLNARRQHPPEPLRGTVIHRLQGEGHLLMAEDGTICRIDLLPGRAPVPEGAKLKCSAHYVGIYEYHSVEGVTRRVKHWREMTEAERTGRKWMTYAEFCEWLKRGNICELRKSESIRCTMCSGAGLVHEAAAGPRKRCPRCAGSGRDTLTTSYHLVWTAQPAATPPPKVQANPGAGPPPRQP